MPSFEEKKAFCFFSIVADVRCLNPSAARNEHDLRPLSSASVILSAKQ